MNIKRFLFPLLLVFSGMALLYRLLRRAFSASVAPVTTVDSSAASFEAIDAFIEREMRRMKMPGVALAIVEGDRIVHQRGFGRARPGGSAPFPQTPFFIGSLTKSITASAVMQLVEAGKITLDDPVQCYLPWFRVADPHASAQMTVRHLLNQTSGLPESAGELELSDFDDGRGSGERQARALASLRLAHPPGAACAYANMNYNLLGLIIEAVTGEAYADTIQKQLFDPLEMRHSYASPDLAQQNGLARGHQYWFGIPFAAPNLPIPHGSLPSGQLISSTEDMAHYLTAHLNGGRYGDKRILSSASIDELQRGVLEYKKMGVNAGRYAMGWFVTRIGQKELLWHGGTMPDFGAYMALLPEQKKAVVLLCNADHYWMNPVLAEFGTGVTALLAGERYAPMPLFRIFPGALLWLLLIPVVQVAAVGAAVRLLQQWRRFPASRPSGRRAWSAHVLLPLIPQLLIASTLIPMLSKRRGFLKLFMPDYAWIAMICGSFALVWSFIRTALVLRGLRKSPLQAALLERA